MVQLLLSHKRIIANEALIAAFRAEAWITDGAMARLVTPVSLIQMGQTVQQPKNSNIRKLRSSFRKKENRDGDTF